MKRADAQEMDACWSKPTCKEKIDCWSPKMAQMMSQRMGKEGSASAAAAPAKKK